MPGGQITSPQTATVPLPAGARPSLHAGTVLRGRSYIDIVDDDGSTVELQAGRALRIGLRNLGGQWSVSVSDPTVLRLAPHSPLGPDGTAVVVALRAGTSTLEAWNSILCRSCMQDAVRFSVTVTVAG